MQENIIAVDLDGVLAHYDKYNGLAIGDPLPGAVEFTRRLSEIGDVLIYTVRCSTEYHRHHTREYLKSLVKEWLDKHEFVYHDIWTGQGKPHVACVIDDRNVYCPKNPREEEYGLVLETARLLMSSHEKGQGRI